MIAPLEALRYLGPLDLDNPRNALYTYAHQAPSTSESAKVAIALGKTLELMKQGGEALDPADLYDAVMGEWKRETRAQRAWTAHASPAQTSPPAFPPRSPSAGPSPREASKTRSRC